MNWINNPFSLNIFVNSMTPFLAIEIKTQFFDNLINSLALTRLNTWEVAHTKTLRGLTIKFSLGIG